MTNLVDYLQSASRNLDNAVQNCGDPEMAAELDKMEARLDEMVKEQERSPNDRS